MHIPTDASDLYIHELIAAGFSAARVKAWCEHYKYSAVALSKIILKNTLCLRLTRGQRLTLGESDRVFRLVHVTAMAEAVFGNKDKALRWLSKPNKRFASERPITMLSTSLGTRLVEELLVEIARNSHFE